MRTVQAIAPKRTHTLMVSMRTLVLSAGACQEDMAAAAPDLLEIAEPGRAGDVQPDTDTGLQMALLDGDDAYPTQGCSADSFSCSAVEGYDWHVCRINQSSDIQFRRNDQLECYVAVCAEKGMITFYVRTNTNAGGEWFLRQGQYRSFRWRANDLDFTAGVSGAGPGELFHFAMGCNN